MMRSPAGRLIFVRIGRPAGLSLVMRAAVASILITCAGSTLAHAEVKISGTATHLIVDAKNATMLEVVSGIEAALNTTVTLSGSTPRQFTGHYSGSVQQVLSRLLDGTSLIISSRNSGLTITLLAAGNLRGGPQPIVEQVRPVNQASSTDQAARGAPASNDAGKPRDADSMGWNGTPNELPPRPVQAPGPVSVAASEPSDSGAMGWNGTPSELPARPATQSMASAQVAAPEPPDTGAMGWNGTPSDLPARSATQSNVTAPIPDPEPANPQVQGWQGTPAEMPPR
jgi:hypothetical protein